MTAPRLLVIMGSGETAPTMVTPHRDIVARFGAAPPKAVLLDTPYGFQENAAEVSQRAVEYFAQRVQLAIEVAGFPGPLAADPRERSDQPTPATLARLRAADLVFSGPGSPTYALSTWQGSSVPGAISDKLAHGGVAIFASAAAVTVGRFSLPVYEIYKVGKPIHWLDGLDLLSPLGFGANCVVVPHFDNAEGGTHDTRFCYMGERRLYSGDTLVLYTDGVTESFNDAGEEFGEDRLIEAVERGKDLSSQELAASLIEEVQQHSPNGQHDDITLIVAKCR